MGAGQAAGSRDDLVAERLKLADVIALAAFGVDMGLVEAGAKIVEAGLGVS